MNEKHGVYLRTVSNIIKPIPYALFIVDTY